MPPDITRRLFAAFFLLLTASVQVSRAQGDLAAKIDEFVSAEMQRQRAPGYALAVIKDGQTVYAKGYGLANLEHQVAVTPETVFQSGSVGKQFTAAAAVLLVEDGKIALDDKISKHLPNTPKAWENITVRHLLTHSAGMTEYPDNFDFRRDYTEDELLAEAAQIPLQFTPGTRWSYSNLGYVTLGILISKVTGKFYGEFLRERIFQPLGMKTARIISEEDIIPRRAAGYVLTPAGLKNQSWVAPKLNTTGDGSLYLTLADMAQWDAALYGEKLLKKSSLETIWSPVKFSNGKTYNYGFGWQLNAVNGSRLIEHGGSWQGFRAHIARYVDEKLTVVAFANLAQANPERIAHGVAALYNPRLAVANEPPRTLKLVSLLREVLQKTADGTVTPEAFTDAARAALFPDKIKQIGAELKPLGAITGLAPGGRAQEDGEFSYFPIRVIFNDKSRLINAKFSQDGKIAGLELPPSETKPGETPELVSFPTADGGLVYAHLYGAGERGVVLAHGGRFNKESWDKQARVLAQNGFRVLALDFRGYGKSTGPGQADPLSAPLYQDVLAAVRYLRKAGAKTVSAIGGSMGGGAAAEASAQAKAGEIDALVLLAHMEIAHPEKMQGRKLFAIARDDFSGDNKIPRLPKIKAQYERAPAPKEFLLLEGEAHAQFMFDTGQGERLMREILRFLSAPA
jgi:CubicO group peptidase (beta-lactamase class C family)/dienelactone hydrolase